MKSLTWDAINKESKDTNVNSVSQSDLMGKLLIRTQAWLEKVTRALPQVVQRVFSSPIKTEWFEATLVQGTHIKYSEEYWIEKKELNSSHLPHLQSVLTMVKEIKVSLSACVKWERIDLGTSSQ